MPFCWLGSTDILTLLIITGHLCVLRKGIMCFYIKHCYEGSLSREAAVITKIKQLQTCLAKCFFNKFSRVCFTAPTWFCGVMYQSCWRVARINSFMQRWEPRAAPLRRALLKLSRKCLFHRQRPSRAWNKRKPSQGVSAVSMVKWMLQMTFYSQVAAEVLGRLTASYSCCFGNHWLSTAVWLKMTKLAALLRLRKGWECK